MKIKTTINGMVVRKVARPGDYRTGDLHVPKSTVEKVLGRPNVPDDPDKIGMSWGFTVDGKRCGIWYYRGSSIASTFGPNDVIRKLFE